MVTQNGAKREKVRQKGQRGQENGQIQEKDYIVEEKTDRKDCQKKKRRGEKKQENSISQTASSRLLFVNWQTEKKTATQTFNL